MQCVVNHLTFHKQQMMGRTFFVCHPYLFYLLRPLTSALSVPAPSLLLQRSCSAQRALDTAAAAAVFGMYILVCVHKTSEYDWHLTVVPAVFISPCSEGCWLIESADEHIV